MLTVTGLMLVVLIAIGVAGCGDTRKTATQGSRSASTGTFVQRGNAACTRAGRALLDSQRADQVAYMESVIAWQREKVAAMTKLEPPKGLVALFHRYLANLRGRAAVFARYVKIVRAGRTPRAIDNEAGEYMYREKVDAEHLGLGRECTI